MARRPLSSLALVPAVGIGAGAMLVAAAGLASPMVAGAALGGVTAVALIAALPYWGFLLTALVIPLERIGRFTNDSSLATVSLMRVVGMITLGALLVHTLLRRRAVLVTTPGLLYTAYLMVGMITLVYTSDFEFGVRAISSMLGNLLFFVLVVNVITNPARARAAIICWLLTTTAVGIFTVYQWHNPSAAVITEDPFNSTGQRDGDQRFSTVLADASEYQSLEKTARALGTTSHPAVYGINLILSLPFFAYLYRTTARPLYRGAIALAGLIVAYNVVLTNTRAALITMVVVVGAILATRLIRISAYGVAAAGLAAALALPLVPGAIWSRVLDVSNYSTSRSDTLKARFAYWEEGLSMVADNWFLGVGIGNQTELPRRLSTRMYMPPNSTVHNEYLQSLIETGALGYPILIAFIVALYRQSKAGERLFRLAGSMEGALLLRAGRVALLAVLFFGTQVDVLHFPLKGWWLAMGIVAALAERASVRRQVLARAA